MRKILYTYLALIPLLFSCTKEDVDHLRAESETVLTLDLNLSSSITRNGMGSNQESINYLDVLVFKINTDNTETFEYIARPFQTVGSNQYKLKLYPENHTQQYRLVVLANMRDEVKSLNLTGSNKRVPTLQTIKFELSRLQSSPTKGMPMWGHSEPTAISSSTISIPMLRSTAKLTVKKATTVNNFEITSVQIRGVQQKGIVAPLDENYNKTDKKVTKPTPDSGTTRNYTYQGSTPVIYASETNNTTTGSGLQKKGSVFLLIQGTFENKQYWYRVELATGNDINNLTFQHILRNHNYNITINRVWGPGANTPDEAVNSTAINITYDVIAWNDSDLNEIEYDGGYYLKVSKGEFIFPRNGAKDVLYVETNHPNGWKAVKEAGSGSSDSNTAWCDLHNITSGQQNKKITVPISIPSSIHLNKDRICNLIITAGKLKKTVQIKQTTKTNLILSVSPLELSFKRNVYKSKELTITTTADIGTIKYSFLSDGSVMQAGGNQDPEYHGSYGQETLPPYPTTSTSSQQNTLITTKTFKIAPPRNFITNQIDEDYIVVMVEDKHGNVQSQVVKIRRENTHPFLDIKFTQNFENNKLSYKGGQTSFTVSTNDSDGMYISKISASNGEDWNNIFTKIDNNNILVNSGEEGKQTRARNGSYKINITQNPELTKDRTITLTYKSDNTEHFGYKTINFIQAGMQWSGTNFPRGSVRQYSTFYFDFLLQNYAQVGNLDLTFWLVPARYLNNNIDAKLSWLTDSQVHKVINSTTTNINMNASINNVLLSANGYVWYIFWKRKNVKEAHLVNPDSHITITK